MRTILTSLGRVLRDGWLMVGLTVLLFLGLEFGYRWTRDARQSLRGHDAAARDSSLHPYAHDEWWRSFTGPDGLLARKNRFDPYRGLWPTPVQSLYVNVDSLGRRATPQPMPASQHPRELFMMGGSTMWGFTARDSFTIPAYTAVALRERGITDVEVVNLAQQGYNSTQEATTLLVELARGHVPAAVVLLNGFNDMGSAWMYGSAGRMYAEEATQGAIDRGTRGFWGTLLGLGRFSALVRRLQQSLGLLDRPPNVTGGPAQICGPLATYYENMARTVDAIGAGWGFPTVRFLQPTHAMSRKRKTPWEESLPVNQFLVPCTQSIDSAMTGRLGKNYFSLSSIFDDDTTSVFIDEHAHVTEAANRKIAERIADVVAPLLRADSTAPGDRPTRRR